jgi:hypothetical protein
MQYFKFFAFTFAFATACGGQVDTGRVRGGTAPGSGGSASGGSGSSGSPSGGAQSGGGSPAGGATQRCQSDSECPTPDCVMCPDFGFVCQSAQCLAGSCVTAARCPDVTVGSCNPAFCAPSGPGVGCCITQNGPCGVDFGNGCVNAQGCQYGGCATPSGCARDSDCVNAAFGCHTCPDGTCIPFNIVCIHGTCEDATACPAPPVYRWFKGCGGSTVCDAPQPPVCDVAAGQSAGAPCFTPGGQCTVGACYERLYCSDRDPCLLI